MCNCNNKRASISSPNNKPRKGEIQIKLMGTSNMTLHGNVTGRMYVFNKTNGIYWVDERDGQSMKDIAGLQLIY